MRRTLPIALVALFLSVLAAAQETPARGAAQAKPNETPVGQGKPEAARPGPVGQAVNIRIEVTITDQREAGATSPKMVSVVVADRENGRVRTGQGNLMLNIDARPEIVRDGRVRVFLSLEYRPAGGANEPTPYAVTESLAAILDDGKPLTVSQSADPASNRTVKVDLKATILK